jgi:hypothetical protein
VHKLQSHNFSLFHPNLMPLGGRGGKLNPADRRPFSQSPESRSRILYGYAGGEILYWDLPTLKWQGGPSETSSSKVMSFE